MLQHKSNMHILLALIGYFQIFVQSGCGQEVVIVGAGVSGLSAAYDLCKNGICNITILEAEDRVGGRLYTDRFRGEIIERGAQWIHGIRGNPVYQMISQNYSVEIDRSATGSVRFSSGEAPTAAVAGLILLAWEIGDDLYDRLDALENPNKEKLKVVLDEARKLWDTKLISENIEIEKTITDAVFEYMMVQWSIDEGERMQNVGVLSSLYYRDLGGGDAIVPQGYSVLLDMLQLAIPNSAIKLGRKVTKIIWDHSKIDSNFTDTSQVAVEYTDRDETNETIFADHVIFTASLGVLQHRHKSMFVPNLPKIKIRALKKAQFGIMNKVFLYYESRFWNENNFPMRFLFDSDIQEEFGEDAHWYSETGEVVAYRDNILLVFVNSYVSREMSNMTDKEIGRKITILFRKFMGNDSIPLPDDILVTRWHEMENFLGSYSYIAPGETKFTKRLAFKPLKLNGVPKVCFAGEATHLNRYGTIDGAYRTGVREARRIVMLKSSKKGKPRLSKFSFH